MLNAFCRVALTVRLSVFAMLAACAFFFARSLQGSDLRGRPRAPLRVLGHQVTSQPKRTNIVAEGSSNEKSASCKAKRLWKKRLIIGVGWARSQRRRDIEWMSSNHFKFSIDYYSSVSGPTRLGVVVVIVSYSVTRTTPGTGSSITSMIVSSTTAAFCLGGFLGAIFPAVFRGCLFGVARFATFLRESLARGFPRFATFLRVATRFFALTIAVSCLPPRA